MDALSLVVHIVSFVLPAIFVGLVLGGFAHWRGYSRRSWMVLSIVGTAGGVMGLVAGWGITGQDGHMLSYGLMIMLEALGITLAGRGTDGMKAKR